MKFINITFPILLLSANVLFAQHARYITSGSVEYSKSVNSYTILKKLFGGNMDDLSQQMFEQYQKSHPQFKVLKSVLTFNDGKTLFTPLTNEENSDEFFGDVPFSDQKNSIFTDLSTGGYIAQRGFYENTYLVKDSVRKINWKITDETRIVAGYACRRANAVILDSVYVVALYTTEIHVSGGPESFTGLPGLILELALPHENVIWRATKVNDVPIAAGAMLPPKKGKAASYKQFYDAVKAFYKNDAGYKRNDLMKIGYLL